MLKGIRKGSPENSSAMPTPRQEFLVQKVSTILLPRMSSMEGRRSMQRMYRLQIWLSVLSVVIVLMGVLINELCWDYVMDQTKSTCEVDGIDGVKAVTLLLVMSQILLIVKYYVMKHDYECKKEESEGIAKESPIRRTTAFEFITRQRCCLAVEILICIINPMPFVSFRIDHIEPVSGVGSHEYSTLFESVVSVLMFLRLYHLERLLRYWTICRLYHLPPSYQKFLHSHQGNRSMALLPNTFSFTFKAALSDYPVETLGTLSLFFILILAYCVKVVEGPVNEEVSYYWNSIWLVLSAATTTGYGDITPLTHLGRFFCVSVMFVGTVIIAISTATFFTHISLSGRENELMVEVTHDKKMSKLADAAARLIQSWFHSQYGTDRTPPSSTPLPHALDYFRHTRKEHQIWMIHHMKDLRHAIKEHRLCGHCTQTPTAKSRLLRTSPPSFQPFSRVGSVSSLGSRSQSADNRRRRNDWTSSGKSRSPSIIVPQPVPIPPIDGDWSGTKPNSNMDDAVAECVQKVQIAMDAMTQELLLDLRENTLAMFHQTLSELNISLEDRQQGSEDTQNKHTSVPVKGVRLTSTFNTSQHVQLRGSRCVHSSGSTGASQQIQPDIMLPPSPQSSCKEFGSELGEFTTLGRTSTTIDTSEFSGILSDPSTLAEPVIESSSDCKSNGSMDSLRQKVTESNGNVADFNRGVVPCVSHYETQEDSCRGGVHAPDHSPQLAACYSPNTRPLVQCASADIQANPRGLHNSFTDNEINEENNLPSGSPSNNPQNPVSGAVTETSRPSPVRTWSTHSQPLTVSAHPQQYYESDMPNQLTPSQTWKSHIGKPSPPKLPSFGASWRKGPF